MPDGTVIWTSPSGATYVTTPGSALLFPSLCVPTGDIAAPEVVIDHRGERTAMMPKRRRTRTQNRAHRIAAERRHTRQTRPGPTCPDGQLLRRTRTHQRRRRAATLLMQSIGALADETSQEIGGSCANTRRIRTSCRRRRRPIRSGPCSGGATSGGKLRNVPAGPPTISTQGNSTIPSGRGWAIGGCSSSAIRPAGYRSGASGTNLRISGSSAARRSRAAGAHRARRRSRQYRVTAGRPTCHIVLVIRSDREPR